jgi:diphthamide synthase (EF-2-diphthine--ammonia ligase)
VSEARAPILLAWSSGKDSAWSLHVLRQDPSVEVVGLLTTINEAYDRVAMHAVRRALLEAQADAAGLPLVLVRIPSPCPNETYEAAMAGAVAEARGRGITGIAFGDLFLEDIRRYRETTAALAEDMIDGGLQARLTCVDPRVMPEDLAGAAFDRALLARLPRGVDPCGENGEFHTFAWAGPMFRRPVPVRSGEVVSRDGFVFADLLPAEAA